LPGEILVEAIPFPDEMIFLIKSLLSPGAARRRLVSVLVLGAALFFGMAANGFAEEQTAGGAAAEGHEAAEHGLPRYAVPVFRIGEHFIVTNSMVVTWVVALVIIVFAQIATRNIKQVPDGAQNFWEWMVGGLYEFLEGIVGHELVKKTFWFFATIFIFILFTNWFGLLPGIGTVGWGTITGPLRSINHIEAPLLRGANADFNMTFGMACVFFLCWIWWAIRANGFGGFILHLFGPRGDTTGLLKVLMIFVFIIVGVLEVVSILFRPVSLSFRLYGNIFAGENMLEAMSNIVPAFGWLIPIPFYFMELLVGLVQALVFMLLTAVFTLLICTHEEGEHH
jgi:F-type H+-transporting ATPase subunit a